MATQTSTRNLTINDLGKLLSHLTQNVPINKTLKVYFDIPSLDTLLKQNHIIADSKEIAEAYTLQLKRLLEKNNWDIVNVALVKESINDKEFALEFDLFIKDIDDEQPAKINIQDMGSK